YPGEMTIVLQHQFWDFKVEDQQFFVTLSFNGTPERLVVPFAALTGFADPSVKFGLQFQPAGEEAANEGGPAQPPAAQDDAATDANQAKSDGGSAEIISLDTFRKK